VHGQGQAKAFSLGRFAPPERRRELDGWKTPQARPAYEPILVAQKPPEGTLVESFLRHGVGLMRWEGEAPSSLLEGLPPDRILRFPKPKPEEKGLFNTHPTVKPVPLLRRLIGLFAPKGGLVLDPFAGSGSTLVAARLEGRRFLGFEINREYYEIARRRLEEAAGVPKAGKPHQVLLFELS